MRCLQFDNEKIISGSWDMTVMVRIQLRFAVVKLFGRVVGRGSLCTGYKRIEGTGNKFSFILYACNHYAYTKFS